MWTGLVAATAVVLLAAGCEAGEVRRDPAATEPVPSAGEDRSAAQAPPQPGRPRGVAGPVPVGTEGWRADRPLRSDLIAAYTTTAGGVPGTRVGVKVSTPARGYRVEAYRIGAYDGGSGLRVWRSDWVSGRVQGGPVFRPATTRTIVAPWRRDLTVDTDGWEPGFYVLTLTTGTGWMAQVPYVVTSPSTAGTVAMVVPVTTWQAYNEWGGYSLYEGPDGDRRAWAVSFDRPYEGVVGANDFRTAQIPVVERAEDAGVPLSYLTNLDLERPGVLDGADGYVSFGHDEYWTPAMRDTVVAARDTGTNLAFLGANTMYWRIRVGAHGRLVTGYRADAHLDPEQDGSAVTARFRDAPAPAAENAVVGMLYECYPVDADYRVASPDWWGFRGTGVEAGSVVPGLVGPEADRVYPDAATPRPLQVLSHSPYTCGGVSTSAQSVYYTTRSGAGVFAAGTLRWGCALVDRCVRPLGDATRRFVHVVTGNLLREFARGPVGARYPARDNLDRFDLPTVNSVGAS